MKLGGGSEQPRCLTLQHPVRGDDSDWDILALAVRSLHPRGLVGLLRDLRFIPSASVPQGAVFLQYPAKLIGAKS